MRKQHIIVVALVAACGAALAGTWAARWTGSRSGTEIALPPPVEQQISGLTIGASDLDFGETWGDQDYAIQLPITNVTDQTIQVDEFQTACDCRPVEPKSLAIPPGETREIRLVLDREKQPPGSVGRPRRIETEIRPVIHGRATAKAWKVRGTVRPFISTDISAVLFGESNRAGQPPIPRRVRIQFQTAGVAKVEFSPPVADVQMVLGNAPTQWTAVVTPFTDRAPGPFKGTLRITNLSPDGRTPIATLDLPVEGILLEGDK